MLTLALLVAAAVLVWPLPGVGATSAALPARGVGEATSGPDGRGVGNRSPAATLERLRRRLGPRTDGGWVADLAEVVAVGLDAGLDLPAAVLAAARSPAVRRAAPWLEHRVVAAVETGRSVSSCLDELRGHRDIEDAVRLRRPERSRLPGARSVGSSCTDAGDLGLLVAAWRLAEDVGAPAAAVTSAAAEAVREGRASRQRAEVVVAGPRTSMWLLTALPLLGPAGGLLLGFGPDRLYGSSAARLSATTGVLLTLGGWWWAHTVLARAARPATTGRPVVHGRAARATAPAHIPRRG